jgi:hypothetical protein
LISRLPPAQRPAYYTATGYWPEPRYEFELSGDGCVAFDLPVAVEGPSWGAVKALY